MKSSLERFFLQICLEPSFGIAVLASFQLVWHVLIYAYILINLILISELIKLIIRLLLKIHMTRLVYLAWLRAYVKAIA